MDYIFTLGALTLRPLTLGDSFELLKEANSEHVQRNMGDGYAWVNMDQMREWVKEQSEVKPPHHFAIDRNGRLKGLIGIIKFPPGREDSDIYETVGFTFRDLVGFGHAADVLPFMAFYSFHILGISKLMHRNFTWNRVMGRIALRCGYTYFGRFKIGFKNNQWVPQDVYIVTANRVTWPRLDRLADISKFFSAKVDGRLVCYHTKNH